MESHSKRSMAIISPILYKKSPTLLQIKLWVARVAQGATRVEPPPPANSPFPSTPPLAAAGDPLRGSPPGLRKAAAGPPPTNLVFLSPISLASMVAGGLRRWWPALLASVG